MEKKKLQRIVGISVVVAFVIVLIPFLFTKKDMAQQEASTSDQQSATMAATDASQPANPTPDANQTNGMTNSTPGNTADATNANMQNNPASNAEDNGITPVTPPVASNAQNPASGTTNPADMNNQPAAPANSAQMNNTPAAPTATMNSAAQNTNANNAMNPANPVNSPSTDSSPNQPAATATPTASIGPASAENAAPSEETVQMAPAVSTDVNNTVHPQVTAEKTAAVIPVVSQKAVKTKHVHKSLVVKKASHTENLANLKKPAWVVQMGSFKDKSNAHRMVDQLRSSGYKAFTHEVTSPKGVVRTRVYIGPEFKQASAQQLTAKIEHDVKLRGYVVPYKPMAL